eukprot:TRINITY_DN1063_c0_g4_i1.p1 TRINITY_DN1063_c0_g4~~TRINITY_DN1063_c0_g4_i1.p1  ORF type:complete len:790 (-),score=250.83 TRINITY_DN1063_c0_g4_i1:307-2676(-)
MDGKWQHGDVRSLSEYVSSFLDPCTSGSGTSSVGFLAPVKWRQFWEALFSVENSTAYLVVLITRLASLEVGDKAALPETVRKLVTGEYLNFNTKDLMKPLQEQLLNRYANLETVLFCALFLPFSPGDQHFRTALTYWNNVRFSADMPSYNRGATLRGSRLPQETDEPLGRFITELIQTLKVGRATDATVFPDFVGRIKEVEYTAEFEFLDENVHSRMVGNAFLNAFVMMQLRTSWTQGTAVLEVMQKMLGKVSVVNVDERPRLHSFVHQLRLYLTQCPFYSEDFLREAVFLFKQLYLVPRPVGDVARDMLHMLTLEFKAPGETLRRAIFAEVPELVKAPCRGMERHVHVFADNTSRPAMLVLEMLRMQHVSEPDVAQLQADVLNHILRQDEAYAKSPAALERLPADELGRYYDDAIELMNACVRTEPQRVELYRRSELRDLIVDVEFAIELLDVPSPVPPPPSNILPPRIPTLPPLFFETDSFGGDNLLEPRLDPKLPLIPKRATHDLLLGAVQHYQPLSSSKSPPVAKVGIVGGDQAVHNMLAGYVYAKLYSSPMLNNVDIQFYLIPDDDSEFASFLAQHDAWYAQQMLYGVKGLLRLWPALAVPERPEHRLSTCGSGRGSLEPEVLVRSRSVSRGGATIPPTKPLPEGVMTPDAVLRSEIESLFREARFKTELRIYQCECWSAATDPTALKVTAADFVVPFVQRAEIGVKPARASSMMSSSSSGKGAGLAASRPDTPSQKTFKFPTPVLTIKFAYSNCLGETREGQKLDPRSYHSITLASTPLSGSK